MQKHAFILSQGMLALEPSPSEAILENAGPGALMATRWRIDPAKPSQKTMKQNIISLIHQRQCRSSCLPSQISLHHAGRQQILNIFLADHLPSEVLKDRSPVTRQRYWLLQIQDAPVLSPALESAILAICIAKLGRKYNDRALVCEGLLMYTKGLRQLRQALRNAKSRGEDETLAACLALIMFESAHCPNQSTESILAHYQGAMNLLKLRGPEAYTTGLAHCMLQILRIQSVSARSSPYGSSRLIQIYCGFKGLLRNAKAIKNLSRRQKMVRSAVEVLTERPAGSAHRHPPQDA